MASDRKSEAGYSNETHYSGSHSPSTPPWEMKKRATEWQPIETAPKDGTEILAFNREDGSYSVIYRSFNPDFDWLSNEDNLGARITPTHWMPLPEPPA